MLAKYLPFLLTSLVAFSLSATSIPSWVMNPAQYSGGCFCVAVNVSAKKGANAQRIQDMIALRMAQSELAKLNSVYIDASTTVSSDSAGNQEISEMLTEHGINHIDLSKAKELERYVDDSGSLYVLYGYQITK